MLTHCLILTWESNADSLDHARSFSVTRRCHNPESLPESHACNRRSVASTKDYQTSRRKRTGFRETDGRATTGRSALLGTPHSSTRISAVGHAGPSCVVNTCRAFVGSSASTVSLERRIVRGSASVGRVCIGQRHPPRRCSFPEQRPFRRLSSTATFLSRRTDSTH